jgi:hypothetical protein
MKQVLVIFRLHEGAEPEAEKLAAAGPPLDLEKAGFERLAVYLIHNEVIFVFEGEEPEWREDELVSDYLQLALRERLDEWRKLADVQTWPASPIFVWEASAAE